MGEGVGGIQLGVELWVVFGEPFFAFLGCAAIFTVLSTDVSVESEVEGWWGGKRGSYLLPVGGSRHRSRRLASVAERRERTPCQPWLEE